MLWWQFSASFSNFRVKKLAFFLKINVMIQILQEFAVF
jgi:uncharacterized protein YecE (DUF72 family)